MNKILIAFLLLLLPVSVFAWSLVCDPQTGVTTYDVEVNGTVIAADYPAETDGSIIYNIDHLGPGPVTFRLLAKGVGGWGADAWSLPFDAAKPVGSGGLRIIK